jgi:outer membrane protein assembly factor BamB
MTKSLSANVSRRHLMRCFAFALVVGLWLAGGGLPCLAGAPAASPDQRGLAAKVLNSIGARQGVCVVLGDAQCALAKELARQSELLIYVQVPDSQALNAARHAADAAGFYGTRICVEQGSMARLFLADDLADVLVAVDEGADINKTEALRVLRPQGKAFLGKKELTKPFPPGVDDWSHPYHGPDNNPASRDQLARGPYLTHFLADPRYAPLPQVAVISAGRVFKLFGHIAFKDREEPWLNTLAAFNGYNGAFLWRREVPAGIMVHRNTLIATPAALYYADDKSCKVLDAATGQVRDEIAPSADVAGGTFWKWMALQNGVLYAMIGEQEQRDPTIRMHSDRHGWPWDPLSPGYTQKETPWGFGQNVLAIDPKTKRVLWQHRETEAIDSRTMCMANGRIFVCRQGSYLACLDVRTGKELWRKSAANAPELMDAMGWKMNRQDWRTNWRTTAFLKCSDKALYFSGPTFGKLLALSALDGHVLWEHPYNNYQLVLEDDGLYALSGQIDKEVSRKFNPLTGQVLEEVKLGRRACTRPTGGIDAIFCRANGGSTRWDKATDRPQLISPMRAQCQDGINIANGLLYWWPSVCDCNLSLYGITCLGPAGNFDFAQSAKESQRLETSPGPAPAELPQSPADWPSFRADNTASASSSATVPNRSRRLWQTAAPGEITPTAPTAAGGLVFLGGSDGIVRVLDAEAGRTVWTAYTGGSIRFPPTIAQGRAFVASGDGWVYALEARTGRLLWRFRAAPVERRIPVYGQLQSTWPAASGVLVQDGVVYVAAGIVNYDGTHVYALDAATGHIKWQNNTSGHLDPTALAGVSVQGHMIIHDGKLWLAGGNAVSPGIYDLADGKCLSDVKLVNRVVNNNVPASESPRGSELYLLCNNVMVSDQPLYAHPQYKVCDATVIDKTWLASRDERDFIWVNNSKDCKLACYPRMEERRAERMLKGWGRSRLADIDPVWEADCKDCNAVALCQNALVAIRGLDLVAFHLGTGKPLWSQWLPGRPVPWGLALDKSGRAIVALEGGQVVCYGGSQLTASR